MEWKYPRCLKKGMTIGCIAPASSSDESLDAIQQICEEHGYQIIFGESCYRTGLYGGSPEEQAQEFEWMMTAAPCDAALHMAINRYSRLVTYHGPMGVDFTKSRNEDIHHLFEVLEGKLRVIEPLPEPPRGAIGTELGDGILRGGNMTMLSMLCGTPYFLEDDSIEDTILFIEDVGEAPYKLDRMLQQWRLSGLLSRIKGMMIGTFTDCEGDEDESDYDIGYEALRYMEENRAVHLSDPFVCYVPTGHGTPHQTLPLGGHVHFRYISNTIVLSPYTEQRTL